MIPVGLQRLLMIYDGLRLFQLLRDDSRFLNIIYTRCFKLSQDELRLQYLR